MQETPSTGDQFSTFDVRAHVQRAETCIRALGALLSRTQHIDVTRRRAQRARCRGAASRASLSCVLPCFLLILCDCVLTLCSLCPVLHCCALSCPLSLRLAGETLTPSHPVRLVHPHWRYIPLTADRTPLPSCTLEDTPTYWNGAAADDDQLSAWCARGGTVGLLPQRSGLVIIDCDVRADWVSENGSNGSMRLRERYGLTDLLRVTRACGRQGSELATYTVRSRSGGLHLYYQQNPQMPVISKTQRRDWLIDVKASAHSYVVAPPSAGYQVLRERDVSVLPLWLARHITLLHQRHPLASSSAASSSSSDSSSSAPRVPTTLSPEQENFLNAVLQQEGLPAGLLREVSARICAQVTASNTSGGWNNSIYRATHLLLDTGLTLETVQALVLSAARPWNPAEQRTALRTIASAYRKHQRST